MSSRVDFDTVRRIGLELPGVEEATAYGSPALKLRGKLLAGIPVNRSAEPGSLNGAGSIKLGKCSTLILLSFNEQAEKQSG